MLGIEIKGERMTREEAIHIIENLNPTNTNSSFDAYVIGEALTMAISALSVPEREKETDAERIKQNLSELAQYNADMLKAFNAGKELAEKEKKGD